MGGGQTSPFGGLAASLGIPTGAPGAPGSNVAGPPAPGQTPLGLWNGGQGASNQGRTQALNQAMNLIKPPQIQPSQQPSLLSGPRQPNPFMGQLGM